jgi:hypothetical protein
MNGVNYHYDEDFNDVVPLPINYKSTHSGKEALIENFNLPKSRTLGLKRINWIAWTFCISFFSLATFEVFLTMGLESDNFIKEEPKYKFLNIPLQMFLFFFSISLNGSIYGIVKNYTNLGKFFILFTFNSIMILIMIFVLFLTLKLDQNLTGPYSLFFSPLYVTFITIFVFICFIFPGMIDKEIQMYKEAFLLTCYFIVYIMIVLMLALKLDQAFNPTTNQIFYPFYGLTGIHLLLTLSNLKNKKAQVARDAFLIIGLWLSVFVLCSKLDQLFSWSWGVTMIFPEIYTFYVFIIGSVRLFQSSSI